MKYDFDCLVIGAGIAGMTSAIYLKRANVNTAIIENDVPGGTLNKITSIENYPGIINSSGSDIAYNVLKQVNNLNIPLKYGRVIEIDDHFVKTDKEILTANKIIIATGRPPRRLGIEDNLLNVSYCALCDGSLYKNKVVAIIGGGSSALEEALYLAGICDKLIIINRSNKFRADALLQEKVKKKENIVIKMDSKVLKINSKENIAYELETETEKISIDGLFIYIGFEPNTDFVKTIKLKDGYIVVNKNMQTSDPNIYACGDIIDKDVYQLTTAVGEATIAAVNVKKALEQ